MPYRLQHFGPQIIKSYCAYIDVLGFRDLTMQSQEDGSSYQMLCELIYAIDWAERDLFSEQTSYADLKPEEVHWNYQFFSDNLIIGYPKHEESTETAQVECQKFLPVVAVHQMNMAITGFFVRGAISYGPLYLDKNAVFGSALVEATDTEKQAAIFPRIVLSKSARAKLDEQTNCLIKCQGSFQDNYLLVDADGLVFVNYLRSICWDGPFGLDFYGALEEHKNRVQLGLNRYKGRSNAYYKYRWIAEYHNYFCKTFGVSYSEPEELKLKTVEPFNLEDWTIPDLGFGQFTRLSEGK